MTLQIGELLDNKYQIVRLLGEGGMGAVYEGLNLRIHRRVAIKVLHSSVAESADAVQRFEREAQAAGRIGSKHIVEVLDLGELPHGERYMVMEFLEGESLASTIERQGSLSPEELYPLLLQILQGLEAAHAAGIVHRDLKPDNIFLLPATQAGQAPFVKILDFGISKFNALGGEFSMTRTGAVMGTPYYMSPEQAKGTRDLDLRTDLYSVGVILYESLTGRVPFVAETFNELLFKIALEEPPSLQESHPHLHPGFLAIVAKAMARDPAARYQTAGDFQMALQMWAERGSVAPLTPPAPAGRSSLHSLDATVQAGTAGAWTSTGAELQPVVLPRKTSAGLYALLALLVVGGAGAVWFLTQADPNETELLAASPGVEEEQTSASGEEGASPVPERKEESPSEPSRPEENSPPVEEKKTALPESSQTANSAKTPQSAPTAPKGATTAPRGTVAPRASTTGTASPSQPPPAPSAPPPEKKDPGSVTSTGRTIRSTL